LPLSPPKTIVDVPGSNIIVITLMPVPSVYKKRHASTKAPITGPLVKLKMKCTLYYQNSLFDDSLVNNSRHNIHVSVKGIFTNSHF
jgi:hypothetical protein